MEAVVKLIHLLEIVLNHAIVRILQILVRILQILVHIRIIVRSITSIQII